MNGKESMLTKGIFAAVLIVVPGAFTVWVLYKLWQIWPWARLYMNDMQTCGFLDDPPDDKEQRRLMRLARFFTWLFVGKVEVEGEENLDRVPGDSYIVAPNHPSYKDIIVIPYVLNRKARYMAARGVMRAFGGLGALLVGPIGAFACDLDRGKGGPALLSAVKILVMFPEGWTYLDGTMHAFKKGAVRIARLASEEVGDTTYIVPVNLKYGGYPGKWILRLPIQVQYAVLILLFPLFRNGVKVVIGEPIASTSFGNDDALATAMLQEQVGRLG